MYNLLTACGNPHMYLSPWSTTNITSPYYPGPYFDNANCMWSVTTHNSMRQSKDVFPVSAYSLYFILHGYSIEHHTTCSHDSLQIDNNPKICGSSNISQAFLVQSNVSVIKFKSDSSAHSSGFKMDIKAIPCEFVIIYWRCPYTRTSLNFIVLCEDNDIERTRHQ